jgi:16S rRNA (cytidine1402-2'-O)-methyltransferase
MPATLYLIPNLLGDTSVDRVLPDYNIKIINQLKHFIIETPKNANALLKKAGVKTPFEGITFYTLDEHTHADDLPDIIEPLAKGYDVGLITDAGMPVVADPGEMVVMWAHENKVKVVPLIGPSSIFLALAASGLNAESFTFHGYLPVKPEDRKRKIKELDVIARKTKYTQIFIETPYRNQSLLQDLVKTCHPDTKLCVAENISMLNERIRTFPIFEWQMRNYGVEKMPAVFLIG